MPGPLIPLISVLGRAVGSKAFQAALRGVGKGTTKMFATKGGKVVGRFAYGKKGFEEALKASQKAPLSRAGLLQQFMTRPWAIKAQEAGRRAKTLEKQIRGVPGKAPVSGKALKKLTKELEKTKGKKEFYTRSAEMYGLRTKRRKMHKFTPAERLAQAKHVAGGGLYHGFTFGFPAMGIYGGLTQADPTRGRLEQSLAGIAAPSFMLGKGIVRGAGMGFGTTYAAGKVGKLLDKIVGTKAKIKKPEELLNAQKNISGAYIRNTMR